MTARRDAGRLVIVALALAVCAGCSAPSREVVFLEPSATPPPTATPAPAPTVEFPMPVEETALEPAPAEVPAQAAASAATVTTAQAAIEDRIFALANEARAAAGVGQLQRLGGLDSVARGWSQNLASGSSALSHNPSYSSQIPSGWSTAAENVAWINDGGQYSGEQVAQAIHQGWMNSTGHRENLLNAAFTHLGVGVVQGPNGYYATQNFATY